MVAKDFLNYVLRDDATVHGGVSFHGETLGDFIAETDLTENSDMDDVNQALIECGIMPVPFDGMLDAFSVEGLDCFSDEPIVLYYMSLEAALTMSGTLVEYGSEITVTDMVNSRIVFEGGKEAQKRALISAIKCMVQADGGCVHVCDEDSDSLRICDGEDSNGEDEGEWHCVVRIDCDGVGMDNDDFYPYNDLSTNDLGMLAEFLEEKN